MSETTTTAWSRNSSKVNNNGGAATSNKRPRPHNGGGGITATSATAVFIPSQTWQGSRPGYYFGTTDPKKGTGYYLDKDDTDALQQQQQEDEPQSAANRRRRVVRIAEENNQVRTLPATATLSNAERLLQEAEAAAAARDGGGASGTSGATSAVVKPMDLTVRGVQQAALGMKRIYERNQLERAEHVDDPTMYMDSEVSLYEYLRAWKAVAANAALLYPVVLDCHVIDEQLVQLLQHDNTDIRIAVIALLVEWLDVSLLLDDETGAIVPAVVTLASNVVQECSELLVANLGFLHGIENNNSNNNNDNDDDTSNDDDEVGQGAADILTLIENLLEMDMTLTTITAGMMTSNSDNNDNNNLLRLVPDGSSVAMQLCRQEQSNNNGQSTTTATNHHLIAWLLEQAENTKSSIGDRCLELLALLAPREDVHQLLPNWSRIPAYRSMFEEDDANDVSNGNADKKPAAKRKQDKEEAARETIDGIEILLQRVAPFRKLQQIQDDSEIEVLENASMILAAALYYSSHNVTAFVEAQGIELVLRCLKARTHAGGVTLRWLDFIGSPLSLSLSSSSSSSSSNASTDASSSSAAAAVYRQACEHLIDAGALKYIFPLLMGRSLPKPAITTTTTTATNNKKSTKLKKAKLEWHHNIEQTTIRILYALTRHLTDNSPNHAKERLLAKFVENNAEKCKRIVDLCLVYDQKARAAEYKFYRSDLDETLQGLVAKEDNNDDNDEESSVQLAAALNAKLKGGGDLFHRLGAICAFCCTGSRTCHEQVLAHLHAKESGIGLIREALQEFISILGDDEQRVQLSRYLEQL